MVKHFRKGPVVEDVQPHIVMPSVHIVQPSIIPLKKITRTQLKKYIPISGSYEYRKAVYSKVLISSFERLNYDQLKEKFTDDAEHFCVICLEEYSDNNELVLLPCDHHLHFDCLSQIHDTLVQQMGNSEHSDYRIPLRCPYCQLNLVRYYLLYKENGFDPKNVKFYNKE